MNKISSKVVVCIMACNSNVYFVQFIVRFCSFLVFQSVLVNFWWGHRFDLELHLKKSVVQWKIYIYQNCFVFCLDAILTSCPSKLYFHSDQLIMPLCQSFVYFNCSAHLQKSLFNSWVSVKLLFAFFTFSLNLECKISNYR